MMKGIFVKLQKPICDPSIVKRALLRKIACCLIAMSIGLWAHCYTQPEGEPCVHYSVPQARAVVENPAITELSGLAVSRVNKNVLWAIQDSQNPPVIWAIDLQGHTLGQIVIDNAPNIDWEDITIARCDTQSAASWCLYVADIGDNLARRGQVRILKIEEPLVAESPLSAPFERHATAQIIPFTYPEGAQDAEALVVSDSEQAFVFTKRLDATSHLMRVDLRQNDRVQVAELLGVLKLGEGAALSGLPMAVTAASLWPKGNSLVIRTYFYAFEYLLKTPGDLNSLFSSSFRPVPLAFESQGEAIAYDPVRNGYWHVSEGAAPTLYYAGCAR